MQLNISKDEQACMQQHPTLFRSYTFQITTETVTVLSSLHLKPQCMLDASAALKYEAEIQEASQIHMLLYWNTH